MKKPIFTNLTKEQSDYINYLEKFNTSNIGKLIKSIDDTAGIIADDIAIMSKSNDEDIDSKLKMLGSGKTLIFNKYMSLVASLKNFKNIMELKPDIQSEEDKTEEIIKTASRNMFEEISEKVKKRNGNI